MPEGGGSSGTWDNLINLGGFDWGWGSYGNSRGNSLVDGSKHDSQNKDFPSIRRGLESRVTGGKTYADWVGRSHAPNMGVFSPARGAGVMDAVFRAIIGIGTVLGEFGAYGANDGWYDPVAHEAVANTSSRAQQGARDLATRIYGVPEGDYDRMIADGTTELIFVAIGAAGLAESVAARAGASAGADIRIVPSGDGRIRMASPQAGSLFPRAARLPDEALVVKGGLGKNVRIDIFEEPGIGQITGTSASSNLGKTVKDLSAGLPNGQVRVITVREIRTAGGDVIATRRSPLNPDHVTITGLSPEQIDRLLGPPIPNPGR
jgi:hypothetical protein